MCPSFPFDIEDGIWYVIVLIPDHCLLIYFAWWSFTKLFSTEGPRVQNGQAPESCVPNIEIRSIKRLLFGSKDYTRELKTVECPSFLGQTS